MIHFLQQKLDDSFFNTVTIFKTGLSDFHLLTVTEFKMRFQKLPPKKVNYRDHNSLDNEKFRSDISKFAFDASDLEGFKNTIFSIFNKDASIKDIGLYIRAAGSSIYEKGTAQSHYEKIQT